MRSNFRSLCFGLLTLGGAAAMAQNTVTVMGSVSPCDSTTYLISIASASMLNTVVTTDANCSYSYTFTPFDPSGQLNVQISCDGGVTWGAQDSASFNADPSDTVVVDLSCGVVMDCLGIAGGTNLPGTFCMDSLGGLGFFGNWDANCICQPGTFLDCLGVPGGMDLPGTTCTDMFGNAGSWSSACICLADSSNTSCNAGFWVAQAYSIDSLNPQDTTIVLPIPNEVWVYNLSSGGNGTYQFTWDFGDGSSSTDAYPTHNYDGPGPWLLCLTMNSGGCTDTFCDSVSVDANGILNGMIVDGHATAEADAGNRDSGFTLNVIQSIPTGIAVVPTIAAVKLWPNPVRDELDLSMNSRLSGTLPITVIDPSGRIRITTEHAFTTGANTLRISTGTLEPGLYMVRIGNDVHSTVQRFIKVR
ncbi:MAG: T9SS type A sorting domain-containing protein [Flavobacteriales bacterium]